MLKNNEIVILEEGIEVQQTKSYGVGIDCHSKFIQVSVLVKRNLKFFEYRHEFSTDWNSLVQSKSWTLSVITQCSEPALDMDKIPFHYCIESTSTYHMPILLAWEGTPSIINPTIAGATKRKTDVLDAKMLALHDLTGVWPQSYLPSSDIKELRVMLSQRNRYVHEATSAGNRINNILVRFGITLGREGSVVKSHIIREIIEQLLSDSPSDLESSSTALCPIPIPPEVKRILKSEYKKYDTAVLNAESLYQRIHSKVISIKWETSSGTLSGADMLTVLTTAPQIGELTAITFLIHVITPRRFSNAKALCAYCGLDPSLKISAKHVTSTVKRGGCKELHKALTSAGDRLIRHHNEMFGRWGFMLYQQTGKWKKAANAVGRKLCVALYYMMCSGSSFSYENYNLIKSIDVFDIPVSELPALNPDFRRYIHILEDAGISTTIQMANAYLSCNLGSVHGLGRKFFVTVRDFLSCQNKYRKLYNQLHEKGGINDGQTTKNNSESST